MTTRDNTVKSAVGASDAHPDTDLLPPGREVGPWRIQRLLGAGGMGDVYAVVHKDIGKRAALKVMHRNLSLGLHAERVQLEGQVVNRVEHPNVVDIFDSGTIDGRPYLVMQRLEGVTLAHLAAAGRMPPGLVIEILMQLCDALGAAHAANVVHRDLKPDNIFLVNTGAATPQVKLLDWGIAKVIDDGERRTMQGQLIGTPDYLAPEQASGKPITPSTDVYALGVIAYRLFVGCLPFAATTAQDMLTMHVRDAPLRPALMWPEIPTRLEDLLLAMLAKDPRLRPSIEHVRRQLVQVAGLLVHTCVPEPINPHDGHTRRTSTGLAPATRMLAIAVIILAAIASSSVPTNVGASQVPLRVIAPPVPVPPVFEPPAPAEPPEQGEPLPPLRLEEPAPAVESPPAHKPPRRPHRARRVVSIAAVAPPAPRTSNALVDRYVATGRMLAARKQLIDASDLWTKYRRLQIYDALRTPERRDQAAAMLGEIERELSKRVAVATAVK
jgi:serine/threonine-protein kinase